MIEIDQTAWQVMVSHAERTYPNECCGVLLGHIGGERKNAVEAIGLENAWTGAQGDHYQIKPEDLLQVEKNARKQGLDVVGIFHSHPDCAAYFSETDLKNSCPWYSFIVLSVCAGQFDHARSFLPDADQTQAEEEELVWPKS
jgi:proteasome lid subunit RPN8/RPN11